MQEFNWTTFLIYPLINLMIFLYFFGLAIGWHMRKNSVIAIDVDTLSNIQPIIEQCKIYANNTGKDFISYFIGHIEEQLPIPNGIVRALTYQSLGYTLCFVTSRPEEVRLQTAKFLNSWSLRGELYMYQNSDESFIENSAYIKKQLFDYIANNKKIVGMISLEKGLKGICKQRHQKFLKYN